MNLDQNVYGYQEWHLPSPSSTPKSATFNESLLQTPKADSTSSHFLDAYSTPQVNGHTTPIQTPSFPASATLGRPASSFTPRGLAIGDPAFHVNHLSRNQHLPLPPVDLSRRLSSSPGPLLNKDGGSEDARSESSFFQGSSATRMDPTFMQTPPPTRDSSRKKLATVSGQNSRSASTPMSNFGPNDGLFSQTPVQFPSLPFSPEAVHFPNAGPASAPAYPQSRLFWDQPQNGHSGDVDMVNITDDPFGPTPQRPSEPYAWPFGSPNPQIPTQAFQSTAGPVAASQTSSVPRMSPGQATSFDFSQSESFLSVTSGVDPNMLFSFSNPPPSFGSPIKQHVSTHTNTSADRQPYEHQAQESQREKEEARRSKQPHSRTSTTSSASLTSTGRPGLQRSKTDGGHRASTSSSTDSRSSNSGLPHIPRKSSPLKRLSAGLGAIPEFSHNRPRTRLVIDESGNARTETDFSAGVREIRRASHQDPRTQYPGLWSDDESGSDDDQPVMSRPSSFIFDQPLRLPSKHGRLDSVGRASSVKKARPSSMIALDGSLFEQPEVGHGKQPDYRRFSIASSGSSFGISPSKERPSSPADAAGDAQNALKKVVEGRMRRQERAASNTLKAHNQRWSQASSDLNKIQTGRAGNYASFSDAFSGSPSTMTDMTELGTPSTNRSTLSNGSTRCVCDSTDGDGQLMIQCESCSKWLHTQCLGLNNQNLPSVYLCLFCTTTPARGGRIRENIRPVAAYTSPLINKSTYRR